MDMAALHSVAAVGVSPIGDRLRDLVAFCRDWGRATGDARYLLLADLFAQIEEWREEEQGVPASLLAAVDHEIRNLLPAVLQQEAAVDGSRLAGTLAERVQPLLVPTHVWVRERQQEV